MDWMRRSPVPCGSAGSDLPWLAAPKTMHESDTAQQPNGPHLEVPSPNSLIVVMRTKKYPRQ